MTQPYSRDPSADVRSPSFARPPHSPISWVPLPPLFFPASLLKHAHCEHLLGASHLMPEFGYLFIIIQKPKKVSWMPTVILQERCARKLRRRIGNP